MVSYYCFWSVNRREARKDSTLRPPCWTVQNGTEMPSLLSLFFTGAQQSPHQDGKQVVNHDNDVRREPKPLLVQLL
jgi:hypothetical protein